MTRPGQINQLNRPVLELVWEETIRVTDPPSPRLFEWQYIQRLIASSPELEHVLLRHVCKVLGRLDPNPQLVHRMRAVIAESVLVGWHARGMADEVGLLERFFGQDPEEEEEE